MEREYRERAEERVEAERRRHENEERLSRIGRELAPVIRAYGYVCDDDPPPAVYEPLFGEPRYEVQCSASGNSFGYSYTVSDRGGRWEIEPE